MSPSNAYPWFFFFRVSRISFLVFIPTLFLILFLYRSSYKEGLISQMTTQVEENLKTTKLTLIRAKLSVVDWCRDLPKIESTRYSLINKDGTILCDTLPGKAGKRVGNLTEVAESMEKEFASTVRFSEVFGTQALFSSLKMDENTALRKTVPITSLRDDMGRFDRVLFLRIVPFAAISYLLFLFLFYRASKPLGNVLSKLEKFKTDIPFNDSLRLFYQKNGWASIEEALNKADQRLSQEIVKVKNENVKIAAILESINDDIIAIDNFESILFYNTKFKNNFIRDHDLQELVPKIWHILNDEQVLGAFRSVLKLGEPMSLRGMNFLSSQRPDRFFDLTITPLRGADEKINGALGVFYDVTEFKLTEQMRVDFVANVSHEIRTPLTSVKGYTQVLEGQKAKIDPTLHLFLGKIVSNTERMIQLFNDLLNLSVIESQSMLKSEEFFLRETVATVADNIKTNYPLKKVHVQKDLQLETIFGNQRLLEQVLSNLIDNACKYSGDELNLKVSSYRLNSKAYVSVQDDGPGIAKEHLQRIFERFYRIESSREASRGTGLGLSIVKHIVAKHGGRIWAESEENHGTTFIIELPLF